MPTVDCPVEGFEHIKVTYPDVWSIRKHNEFWKAYRDAGNDITHNTALLYGCIAVSKLEGIEDDDPGDWPVEILFWLLSEVYTSLNVAENRSKKNLSSGSLITPIL